MKDIKDYLDSRKPNRMKFIEDNMDLFLKKLDKILEVQEKNIETLDRINSVLEDK